MYGGHKRCALLQHFGGQFDDLVHHSDHGRDGEFNDCCNISMVEVGDGRTEELAWAAEPVTLLRIVPKKSQDDTCSH